MAFRMNRPVIKGSALHKASIAKAKAKSTSIVAPAEQGADAALVNLSKDLGLSNVGHAIDYSKEKRELDIETKKKEKVVDPGTPVGDPNVIQVVGDASEETALEVVPKQAVDDDVEETSAEEVAPEPTSEEITRVNQDKKRSDFNVKNKNQIVALNKLDSEIIQLKRKQRLPSTRNEADKSTLLALIAQRDADQKALAELRIAAMASPAQKRDDRVWNGAIKGGKVHENMRKGGYIPRNEI